MADSRRIVVRGARTHNLKSIDVELPAHALVAITGPSGAGKSSLAFDTIYAEAQRRYVESLSTQARQLVERLPRPDVDAIEGLSPAIAIGQGETSRSPRSTLGTVTEISDHLRLLFARVGVPHCPICGEVVRAESPQQIVDEILALPEGARVQVLAPIVREAEGDLAEVIARLRREGFVRAIVDGAPLDLSSIERLEKKSKHDLDLVVDRLIVKSEKDSLRVRATDSVELALRAGDGRMIVLHEIEGRPESGAPPGAVRTWHSERFACEKDDFVFPPVTPRLFSFNAPEGACPTCQGLGERALAMESRIVPDAKRTLRTGAIAAWGAPGSVAYAVELDRAVSSGAVTKKQVDVAWSKLPKTARDSVLHGSATKKGKSYEGVIAWIDRQLAHGEDAAQDRFDDEGALDDTALDALREVRVCETCKGARLRREALAITFGDRNIAELGSMALPSARAHLIATLETIDARWSPVAKPLVLAVAERLQFLVDVGVHYLTIDRAMPSMSSGEASRVRLAAQLASALTGVLYVLDEPTLGLHARDTERLIRVLHRLRALGNSVIVVEHDLDVLRASDRLVDVGPVAGAAGGYVVATGSPDEIAWNEKSVTGPWLAGRARLPRPKRRAIDPTRVLKIRGASLHNLKNVDVDVPLGVLVGVTGPSGSGKSSLVEGTLVPAVRLSLATRGSGAHSIDKLIAIDQEPIGRSPRSTPASYVGAMPRLRELYAQLPEAAARGYKPGRFSSNVKGGRCETCKGEGVMRVEMAFLPDAWVVCPTCNGARFNRETLEIKYRGQSIADVLSMSVDDAHALFENVTPVRERLAPLRLVGLGYIQVGQPATTLSGGEAQRVKLARELGRRSTGNTLYVLDEPTTGLHPVDVAVLLDALVMLRDQGNSIVVVEHDLDFVACCDWVIDLGPDAGDEGGRIVARGTPEDVARTSGSTTAPFLARAIAP